MDYIIKYVQSLGAEAIVMGMNPPLDSLVSGRNPEAVRPHWKEYYAASKEIALKDNCQFIDFTPEWLKLSKKEIWKMIPDGLHPVDHSIILNIFQRRIK